MNRSPLQAGKVVVKVILTPKVKHFKASTDNGYNIPPLVKVFLKIRLIN